MACLELDFGLWSETVLSPVGNGRYPISATIELTERCNLSCGHCYINQPAKSQSARAKELSTDQIIAILDKIADSGCLFLVFTGGEPLLRPDFPEIYMHARRLGMLVTLLTNASMMTLEIANMLASSRPQVVDVSIYGATKATYESVTGSQGSFDRFIRGIELLQERNIRTTLKSVILTTNKHELSQMRSFAESYSIPFRYDALIWPRVDGDEGPYTYQISIDEILEMDHEYPQRVEEWKKRAEGFQGQQVRDEYVYSCGAGLRSYHVDSSGYMSICTMVRKPAYNLTKMSFQEVWQNLGDLRKLKRQLETPCTSCAAGALCSQCPGWSQVIHGDNETPVDFVCQLGQMRTNQFSYPMINNYEEINNE